MWECMALTKDYRGHRIPVPVSTNANADAIARQARVEELRLLVKKGAYKADPRRLALRILLKSYEGYSPEKRT
jgi:hypothetical protein